MSNKEALIREIVHLLENEFDGPAGQVTAEDRAFLERSTVSYLESKVRELQSEIAARDPLAKERESLRQTKEATNRAKARLQIHQYSGLTNAQVNDDLLNELLPGPSLSFENFRSLIEQNPNIAARFIWAEQPFSRVVQAEQQQRQQATKDRGVFSAVCRALTIKGLANVSDIDSNYVEVRRRVAGPLTAENVMNLILHGDLNFEFAPNSDQIVKEWIDEAAWRERRALAVEIANDYSLDAPTRQREFDRLMTPPVPLEQLREMNDSAELRKAVGQNSTYENTQQLRERAQEIRNRRAARAMSKEELQGIVAASAQQRRDALNPVLPDSITAQAIRDAKPPQLRKLLQFYGQDLVNQRLQGRG
jgi:hypothetical protein